MQSERNTLSGCPSNKLVRDVRGILFRRLGARPRRDDVNWKQAWEWAAACCSRSEFWQFGKQPRRRPWPSPCEIASQFLLLVMMDMRDMHQLRLPWRAPECVPPSISRRFSGVPEFPRIENTGSAPTTAGERPNLTA